MARTLLGAAAKVIATELTLRRREKFVETVETEKQQALNRVASGQIQPAVDSSDGMENDPGAVAQPGRRIRELMDDEGCGTCKSCLRRLLREPPEGRREGLRVYEGEYLTARDEFQSGEIPETEFKSVTREFFATCGML